MRHAVLSPAWSAITRRGRGAVSTSNCPPLPRLGGGAAVHVPRVLHGALSPSNNTAFQRKKDKESERGANATSPSIL